MPPSLGDSFPSDLKERLFYANLKPGKILRIHREDTTPPKIKRFIVIGVAGDKITLGTVFINSRMNPYRFSSDELRSLCLELPAAGRPYLDHDSFVDCSKIAEYSLEKVKDAFVADVNSDIGDVSNEDLERIIEIVRGARTISNKLKERYNLI